MNEQTTLANQATLTCEDADIAALQNIVYPNTLKPLRNTDQQLIFVSIVLPVHNEYANIKPMYEALINVLDQQEFLDYEIIYVDDGSTDETVRMIEELHLADERVKLVQFFRNFGHQIALSAGMVHATGDVVVTMDADLQHPPETIIDMLEKYRQGNDVVYTIRKGKQKGLSKNITSDLFYTLFRKLTKLDVQNNVSDFRLMSRQVVDVINSMPEKSRFLRGMIPWVGGQYAIVPYKLKPRLNNEPSYSFLKSLRLAMAGLMSFSILPLKFVFLTGIILCILSFAYGIFLIGHKVFIGTAVPGYTDIIASILFLGGVQLVSMSIIGKFLSIVLDEVRGRPNYIVRRTLGINKDQTPENNMPKKNMPSFTDTGFPPEASSILANARKQREQMNRRYNG